MAEIDPLKTGGTSNPINKLIEASKLILGAGVSLAPGFWAKYYPHLNPTIPDEAGFMVLPAMGVSGLISYLITYRTRKRRKRTQNRPKAIWPAIAGFIVFLGAFSAIEALHIAGASDQISVFLARIFFLTTLWGWHSRSAVVWPIFSIYRTKNSAVPPPI